MASPTCSTERSASPASISSLTVALLGMKERCTRQQRRIDELEQENLQLNTSRNDLYGEIKKLHEANVKLRERNLAIGRELHLTNREKCDLRSKWEEERAGHNKDVRQLERLQQEVIKRARTLSREEEREEEQQQISSLRDWAEEATEDTVKEVAAETDSRERKEGIEGQGENEGLGLMAEAGADSMLEIAERLAEQRDLLKAAVVTMQQKKTLNDQAVETVIASSLAAAVAARQRDGEVRRCPMCEATFPEESTTQEQFETHVVDHFSYEEANTLSNFDTVPDAFWPSALQDQSLL